MLYQKHRNIQSFPQNSSGRSLSCWEWSNSDEIISKSVGVMALGDRVRSHRVGICEFILLYLCLFGCINKPYKCGNCNLYGFISFIFASTACSNRMVFSSTLYQTWMWLRGPQLGVPFWRGHVSPSRTKTLLQPQRWCHIPRASEPLRSPHRYVQGGKPKTLYKSCSFIPSCSLKYACSVAECIWENTIVANLSPIP